MTPHTRLAKLRDRLAVYLADPEGDDLACVHRHLLGELAITDDADWSMLGQCLIARMRLLPPDAVAELVEAGRADLRRRAGRVG